MITKNIFVLEVLMILFSCSPIVFSQVSGKYTASSSDNRTTLDLEEDGRFIFIQNNMGVIRTCTGKWELVSEGKLKLKCDDQSTDVGKVLSSGYMESLEEEVTIQGNRKIKMGTLVLKKVKN